MKISISGKEVDISEELNDLAFNEIGVVSTNLNRGFEGSEHLHLGDESLQALWDNNEAVKKYLSDAASAGHFNSKTLKFKLKNELWLTFGEIVALAMDFFAVPNKPVSVDIDGNRIVRIKDKKIREQRFIDAYHRLAGSSSEPNKKVEVILATFAQQEERMNREHEELSRERASLSREERDRQVRNDTRKFMQITTHKKKWYLWSVIDKLKSAETLANVLVGNDYQELLQTNYDHFLPYAKVAYKTGHSLALQIATLASQCKNEERSRLLVLALTLEAYACHAATDMFSAGHMRVLRAELPKYTRIEKYGHLLVHEQHDEDGKAGLWISNKKNTTPWKAYGDGELSHPDDESDDKPKNKQMIEEMIFDGISEVFQTFETGLIPNLKYYKDYWPECEEPKLGRNHFALFKMEERDGKLVILKRKDPNPETCTDEYDEKWSASGALKERGCSPTKVGLNFIFKH